MKHGRGFIAGILLALAVGAFAAGGGFPSKPRFASVGVGVVAPATAGDVQATRIGVGQAPAGASGNVQANHFTASSASPGGFTVNLGASSDAYIDFNIATVDALWVGTNASGSTNAIGAPTGTDYFMTNQGRTVCIGNLSTCKISIGTGVLIGAPTGLDKGTGTLNAVGLYQQGVKVPLTQYAVISLNSATNCTLNGAYGNSGALTSCTNAGTGVYAVTWGAAFSAIPVCTASLFPGGTYQVIHVSPQSTTQVNLYNFTSAFAAANASGTANLVCVG